MLIGLTGKNCAGKDAVADVLEHHGFERHSLSDAIRAEIKRCGLDVTRNELIRMGNELRVKEGPGTLAKRILAMLKTDKAVVVSVRNPGEVEELRKREGFILVGVDAPIEVRFRRNLERRRESAPTTLAQFVADEERENSVDQNNQQLDTCLGLADRIIINDGTKEELKKRVDAFLKEVGA